MESHNGLPIHLSLKSFPRGVPCVFGIRHEIRKILQPSGTFRIGRVPRDLHVFRAGSSVCDMSFRVDVNVLADCNIADTAKAQTQRVKFSNHVIKELDPSFSALLKWPKPGSST